jgi:hypothetical protein
VLLGIGRTPKNPHQCYVELRHSAGGVKASYRSPCSGREHVRSQPYRWIVRCLVWLAGYPITG